MVNENLGISLVVQRLRLHAPNAGGPGSVPGQGTTSHMPQLRSKILHAATKNQHSQINIKKKKKDLSQTDILCLTLKKIKREPVQPNSACPVPCIPTTPWAHGPLSSLFLSGFLSYNHTLGGASSTGSVVEGIRWGDGATSWRPQVV